MKITVRTKPGSKTPGIKIISENHFIICVKEPPKEGKANAAVIKALAEHFQIAPTRITLIKGQTSKEKIFNIE
ncbi:MAG: DUF167 domain-containing protein [bacterium]|nr:DUF167 domain-containing protein [bacterium]